MNDFKIRDLMVSIRPQGHSVDFAGENQNLLCEAVTDDPKTCSNSATCQATVEPDKTCNNSATCQSTIEPDKTCANSATCGSTIDPEGRYAAYSVQAKDLLHLKQALAAMTSKQ